jgi:dephospho-CoA kinase
MGKAGAGKDTVADVLQTMYGYQTIALADNIRDEYERFFPGQKARTDRSKLQEIGETYKKIYGTDVWVRLTVDEIVNEYDNYVVTDGRHQIEYDKFVTELHYLPFTVTCPEEIRHARLLKRDGTLQEAALKKECQELWTADTNIVDNSGTFEELRTTINNLMKTLLYRRNS